MNDLGIGRSRVRRRRPRHRTNSDLSARGNDSFEEGDLAAASLAAGNGVPYRERALTTGASPAEVRQAILARIQKFLRHNVSPPPEDSDESVRNPLLRTARDRALWTECRRQVQAAGWSLVENEAGWMNVLDRYMDAQGMSPRDRGRVQGVFNRTRDVGAAMSEAVAVFEHRHPLRRGIEALVAGTPAARVLETTMSAGVDVTPTPPMAMIPNYFGSEGQCPECGAELRPDGSCPKCNADDDEDDDTGLPYSR